jgi:predicted DCC family thiol-disulfide oxidoreductase YuxK
MATPHRSWCPTKGFIVPAILRDPEAEHIIFFDGVCSLCNAFIDFLIKRDKKSVLRYAPLQGRTAHQPCSAEASGPGLQSLV